MAQGGIYLCKLKPCAWHGADQVDVAQQGWWMSFEEPSRSREYLAPTDKVDNFMLYYHKVAEGIN